MPKGSWTLAYIATIVLINWLFGALPLVPVFGAMIPPVMLIVGFVFVFRDFAQRELGHWIIAAMLVGCLLSYWMATPVVAVASVISFSISETIDWAAFTLTRRPLSQRILFSSALSVPIDTISFLYLVGQFSWAGVLVISAGKMLGTLCFWVVLRRRERAIPLASNVLARS